jgi:hypothetical protein
MGMDQRTNQVSRLDVGIVRYRAGNPRESVVSLLARIGHPQQHHHHYELPSRAGHHPFA